MPCGFVRLRAAELSSPPEPQCAARCGRRRKARRVPFFRSLHGQVIGREPPQDGLGAREEFAQVERLCHVTVRSHFEADDLVDRIASPGNDDEAAAPVFTQPTGDRQSFLARKPQVQQHEGRRIDGHERHE